MIIIYQNLGCMGGNNPFPVIDCMRLLNADENKAADGFVFVEASQSSAGYKDFESFSIGKGYSLYTEAVRPGQNQVIIGLRNTVKVLHSNGLGIVTPQKFSGRGLRANCVSQKEVVAPNYHRILVELAGRPVNLIGARIPHYPFKDKNGIIMPKNYNARLCSFRQMEEALNRDLRQVCAPTVVLMDGNNARYLGSFDAYDPQAYVGKAQKNYNFHILRAEMLNHYGLILKENISDYSFGPAHDDHAFFRGFDMDAVQAEFFSNKGFDHKGIRVKF